MQALTQKKILNEIEEIKAKLISLELAFVGEEKPTKKDVEAVKSALKEYKERKTIPFNP